MKRKPTPKSKRNDGCGRLHPLVSSDLRQLHKLVKEIVMHAEELSMWPLTQQEQISFIRTVIFQARKIRNTEQYVTTDLMLATEAITANALISRTGETHE